ncbi:TPA: hypothetical protein N0F65_004466 [Lagenidium giganteum]|uniref:Structural maintenance of chromosomes protein 5 n=1 Tax=Lagenidium giganteum TaxID=4803 RepID=A0AAV2ZJM7_9STRA|nr:TPA: hypothetical protein N0F65_004466 [Lagenidium giganteum]
METDIAPGESCDEYVDGSIFRVKLHNFLTYTDAEFFPGPRLNLVLGPNGTGKSSIVCALCVGLAGSTKLLGRADKVGQFVRHEKESGYTEIELFFNRGNRVVRRNIFRDNKSTWQINGRDATQKQVLALMESARIQIDNLCQFLPQDKVGEFSRMNPVQLLKATQSAIDDGELAETHERIIELQSSIKEKERDLENARASLELKQNENRQREKEVERIMEHQTRIQETKLMKKKCLWLEFEEMKREVEQLKAEKKRCREEMEKAKEETIVPLQERLEKERLRFEKVKAEKADGEREKRQIEDKLKREKQHVEALENAQSKTVSEITELRNQHSQNQRRLERVENDLAEWRKRRGEMPEIADLKQQKLALEKEQREKEMKSADISSQREAKSRRFTGLAEEIRKLNYKMGKLNDEDVQRRLALQRFDADAIRAAEWVKQNQHKLKRKVWGPVVLEMQVNEPLHAKYVEDILPKWLMTALVAECYEDYNTIIRELNSEKSSQRIKTSIFIVQDAKCTPFNRPYTPDQVESFCQQFGFTGYLDELVKAPDVIHQVLRDHGGMHTVLVGTRQTEDLINRGTNVFQALSSTDRKSAFVTPYKKYVTSVSKYGARNVTTRTNDLQNPRLLAASSSNEEEKTHLTGLLQNLQAELKTVQAEIDDLKAQEREFAESRNTFSNRIAEIRSQLREIVRLEEKISEGENKAYSLKSELARDLSDKENAMVRKLKNQATKQGKQVSECLRLTKLLLMANATDASLGLRMGAQQVRLEFTDKHLKRVEHTIRNFQEAYKRASENLVTTAKQAMQMKKRAEAEAPWEEYEDAFVKFSDDLEDLRACIENNEASMGCFRGDLRIQDIYERVCREIENEERELKELEHFVTHGEDEINGIKDAWHAKLKDVVAQIDASFQEFFRDIGCVGEVFLDDRDTDISKWGIERRAQFRKNTKLSTMTAEEQSGGVRLLEKSVGTIMYLMALQSLTKCPFRVVDEINQGMDVYNERKVFHRITKSSCGSKLPQYFLITPKLITGLSYHRDTKVMVILNGPWNKISQQMWDTKHFINCSRRIKRAADGGVEADGGGRMKKKAHVRGD